MLIIAGIQMAMYLVNHYPSEIIDYLLVDAWDIENADRLQLTFFNNFWNTVPVTIDGSSALDVFIQQSRRISTLGQIIRANLVHEIGRPSTFYPYTGLPQLPHNDLFKFLISQGADIEYRDTFREETALLVLAEVDDVITSTIMPVLLRLDADCSAVDYKGRGPLHLTLKPSRYLGCELKFQEIKDKLVHLLQAGCLIHAVDNYGRTPTYVARKWRRTKAWEAALQEVGKLECATLDCQCEIIVRFSPCLHFHHSVLALAMSAAIDPKLTIAIDRISRV